MSTSNLTKYCACHEISKFKISAETPWIASANRNTFRTMIRAWHRHLAPAASETFLVPPWRRSLYGKVQHFALRLSITCCACHENWHSNFSKYCACHAIWISWHLCSLGIHSLSASILSRHLFSLGSYSLSAFVLSWHLFPLGIYFLLECIFSWYLFFWYVFPLGIYSLLASILSLIMYETTEMLLQHHSILHLPRKMTM